MTNPNYTEIAAIVDRSGSMHDIAVDTAGGLNQFVEHQKKVSGTAKFTLVQFDDRYEVLYTGKDIQEVEPYTLHARGTTALLDAIGKTVVTIGERLAALSEDERPGNVIVVILTDGYENASREYTGEAVKKLIEEQTNKYNWTFIYLGANQDAITTAAAFGIGANNSLTYGANARGVTNAYAATSNLVGATRNFAPTAGAGFTDDDRNNAV